jgi:hypothetical protein
MRYLTVSAAHLVTFEMFNAIKRARRMLATRRERAAITVFRMEAIVYVPDKVFGAMEPRAYAK